MLLDPFFCVLLPYKSLSLGLSCFFPPADDFYVRMFLALSPSRYSTLGRFFFPSSVPGAIFWLFVEDRCPCSVFAPIIVCGSFCPFQAHQQVVSIYPKGPCRFPCFSPVRFPLLIWSTLFFTQTLLPPRFRSLPLFKRWICSKYLRPIIFPTPAFILAFAEVLSNPFLFSVDPPTSHRGSIWLAVPQPSLFFLTETTRRYVFPAPGQATEWFCCPSPRTREMNSIALKSVFLSAPTRRRSVPVSAVHFPLKEASFSPPRSPRGTPSFLE